MENSSKAKDFRARAREALSGNWLTVVLATFVASIFGATVGVGRGGVSPFQVIGNISNYINKDGVTNEYNMNGYLDPYDDQTVTLLAGVFTITFVIALIFALVAILLGAVVSIGLCQYNMRIIDHERLDIGILFSNFNIWTKAVWLAVRRGIFVFLWTLLFIIPGVIKFYSYAMSFFIMAENPEISAGEAMDVSQKMMRGNKWRLFCLGLSFIGWDFLNLFTLGIGSLWLTPYKNAAAAAFYDEISRQPVDMI